MQNILQLSKTTNGIRQKALISDGNLNACLTFGFCTNGCTDAGQIMYPGKFFRITAPGMNSQKMDSQKEKP